MEKKIGIVLSGGGVRASAHAGALKALEEAEIYAHHISGISAGAIVGALYCAGISPDKIRSIIKLKSFFRLFSFRDIWEGFVDTDYLEEMIKKYVPDNSFDSLKTKLTIGVSNLNEGRFELIDKGELANVVAASSAIPLLIKPVRIGKSVYVDGGLMNGFPVEPLIPSCDFIIGINLNPHEKVNHIEGWKDIGGRCFEMVTWNNTESHLTKCNFLIQMVATAKYGVLDVKHSEELFEIGYHETKKMMPRLLDKLIQ